MTSCFHELTWQAYTERWFECIQVNEVATALGQSTSMSAVTGLSCVNVIEGLHVAAPPVIALLRTSAQSIRFKSDGINSSTKLIARVDGKSVCD